MVLSCYLDDSRGEGVHAVGGYLGRLDVWEQVFSPAWRTLLASAPHPIAEFKASHCRHLRGEFAGWTREEADAFTRKCLALMAVDALKLNGFSAAMLLPEHPDADETGERDGRAYMVCFLSIILNVINLVRAIDRTIEERRFSIRFVCDEQPGLQGRLRHEFEAARALVAPDCPFDMGRLQFDDSKELPPLQAADILAYETRKDLKSRLEGHRRERSRALTYLLERRPHVGFYCDDRVLALMYSDFKKGSPGVLPLLYASPDAEKLMPWVVNSSIVMEPPPIIPHAETEDSA